MWVLDPKTITAANILAGSVATPWAAGTDGAETEWTAGETVAAGVYRTRTSLQRVYRCAAARSGSTTPNSSTPPESDPTGWVEMWPTASLQPFGPYVNAAGQTTYVAREVASTTTDLVWRLKLRYATAVALYGLRGARVRVREYVTDGGAQDGTDVVVDLVRNATGYWDYGYGDRSTRDRVLINGLNGNPEGVVEIRIEADGSNERRVTHIDVGSLVYLPMDPDGGTEYGLTNTLGVDMYQQQDNDGTRRVLLYATNQAMQGRVVFDPDLEPKVTAMLRRLLGRGVSAIPTLEERHEERLTFGVLTAVPIKAENPGQSAFDISFGPLAVD